MRNSFLIDAVGFKAFDDAALRTLAYKWIRVLFRCWKDRRPYDEAQYLAALRKAGSPLVGRIDALLAEANQPVNNSAEITC